MTSTEDRLDVVEACVRVAWHADRREWDQLATVLADEVHLDSTSLLGGEPAVVARQDVIAGWRVTAVTMTADWVAGDQRVMETQGGPRTAIATAPARCGR